MQNPRLKLVLKNFNFQLRHPIGLQIYFYFEYCRGLWLMMGDIISSSFTFTCHFCLHFLMAEAMLRCFAMKGPSLLLNGVVSTCSGNKTTLK